MSYTKREWATGNVVGAVDLNRMEQGIEDANGGGVEPLIVNVNDDAPASLDKTWQEIHDAFPNVYIRIVQSSPFGDGVFMQSIEAICNAPNAQGIMSYALVSDNGAGAYITYATNSADGYPTEELD